MIVLKIIGYAVVGVISIILLFFFLALIMSLCGIVLHKLRKIIKKNEYVDRTAAITVNLFYCITFLFGVYSVGYAVCRFIGL